jgi:hypothetical protein
VVHCVSLEHVSCENLRLERAHASSATIRDLVLVEADLDRNLVANPIERWVFMSGRVRSRLENLLASSTCGSALGRVENMLEPQR